MKKNLLITFICLTCLCLFTITASAENQDVEKIRGLFDNTEVYLPEMTTMVDVTAANSNEPYSEVTVTNPNTTTTEPISTSSNTENNSQIKNRENNKKSDKWNFKSVLAIIITAFFLVVALIVRFRRERNERK